MNTDTFLQWLRLGAAVLCANLLLNAQLTAQQQAAEFTPPFEPGDILVYEVEDSYIPQHHYRLIISTGPGGWAFSDKESWFVGAFGYPFIGTGGQQYRHRFTVDSSGIVQHEGDPGDGRYPVYPAFIPQGAAEMARINEIYPNPASQLTTVSFSLPSAMPSEFVLTDMLGRRVRHIDAAEYPAGSHRSMLSVEGLRVGLYLLTLRTPSSTVTRRVIVTP